MKRIVIIFFLIGSAMFLSAETPKREFRSTWLTTVWAIDWPSSRDNTNTVTQAQKNQLTDIFDQLVAANMNAVYFQVRGMSDAFYNSAYEPWSQYLTGQRGLAPQYDPLAFAITEAHARGLELHAWINPYRYATSNDNYGTLPTDYSTTHPEWLVNVGGSYILNPGIPEVRQQIVNVIKDILSKYDVDGIIFDDYFYIDGISDTLDLAQYTAYNPENLSLGDWRRSNVNAMVRDVYNAIQEQKPYVKFGIGPPGVVASSQAVAAKYGVPASPVGSDWQYNGIYSDPLAWLSQGTIDYISPQIYWTIGSSNDYAKLSAWWSDVANHFGKNVYPSHSLSAMKEGGLPETSTATVQIGDVEIPLRGLSGIEQTAIETRKATTQQRAVTAGFYGTEIGAQVLQNRLHDINDAPGSVFYATKKVVQTAGFVEYLKNYIYTEPALIPTIGWKKTNIQPLVTDISLEDGHLIWNCAASNVLFAVYCVPSDSIGKVGCFASSRYLLGKTYENVYDVSAVTLPPSYTYAVSVVDRYGNEFAPMVYRQTVTASEATQLVFPENNARTLLPCLFSWKKVEGVDSYVWQLAEDEQFEHLVCARETVEPHFFSGLQTNLQENKPYFWRVKTKKANALDIYSEVCTFVGDKFSVIYPANGTTDVELTPQIVCDSILSDALYTFEIATSAKFTDAFMVYKAIVKNARLTVPENIFSSSTTYYLRVTVAYADVEAISETVLFITKELPTPIPEIISPENNAVLYGTDIEVCWKEQNAKEFRVELSASNAFPPRSTTIKAIDAHTYCATYNNLKSGIYYLRVKALKSDAYTDPSEYITVELKDNTPVPQVWQNLGCWLWNDGQKQYVRIRTEVAEDASIAVYSLTGMLFWQKQCELHAGENDVILDPESLINSLYMVKIQTNTVKKTLKLKK